MGLDHLHSSVITWMECGHSIIPIMYSEQHSNNFCNYFSLLVNHKSLWKRINYTEMYRSVQCIPVSSVHHNLLLFISNATVILCSEMYTTHPSISRRSSSDQPTSPQSTQQHSFQGNHEVHQALYFSKWIN